MPSPRASLPILGFALLLALASPTWASNGPILSTVGSKGPVTTPIDGDAWSMFRMPSSIGWSWGNQVDLDMFVFYADTTMRNRLNRFESSATTLGANGGVVFALGRIDDDASDEEWEAYSPAGKITLGFGVFVEMAGGTGDANKVRWQTFPETIPLRAGIQFVSATPTIAFTPTEWLSVGLGLHAIQSQLSIRALTGGGSTPLNGSPSINGVPLPGNPTYADFLGLFASDDATDPSTYLNSDVSGFQYSATISVSFRPMDNLGIGISYRPRSYAPQPLEGSGVVNVERTLNNAIGGLDPALRDLFLGTLPNGGNLGFQSGYDVELRNIHVPRQIRASIAWWPVDWLMISAEIAWIEWHRAFRRFNITLEDGTNADLNFIVGSTEIESRLTQRWFNRWSYSFYVAAAVNEYLTIRGGFNHSEVPLNHDVANNTPNAIFVNANFSVGASLNLGRFSFHTLMEYSPYHSKQANDRPESVTGKRTTFSSVQLFFHFGATIRF
jgi:hypothetical protein